MRSVALSILLIGIVAFAFADDALPTDAASCDTPTMQAPATQALDENHIQILVFRNGGNNTGEASLPVVVDMSDTPRKYIADREFFKMVNASRDTLYAGDAARLAVNSTLYNIQGRAVIRRTQLVNGSMYFLVPEGEHFFWPGIYVGHKIERIDVPAAPGQSIIMETLALQPRLFHVRGFLTDEEVNIIHELARGKMRRSVVVSATGDVEDGARTSSNGWLYKKDAPDVLRLNQKCGALAHVDPALELEEAIQVVHYGPGQKYESHYDWFEERHFANDPNWQAGVNRMITIFFYMNNVTEGGHTVFPRAGEDGYKDSEQMNWSDCSRGVKVAPRKGDAIMWYSLKVDGQMKGEGDSMSLHAGCPPLAGEKWAANKWIYNKKKVTGESFFA